MDILFDYLRQLSIEPARPYPVLGDERLAAAYVGDERLAAASGALAHSSKTPSKGNVQMDQSIELRSGQVQVQNDF